jgi:hypothetical protein
MGQGQGIRIRGNGALAVLFALAAFWVLVPTASADVQVCTPGAAAGKCTASRGLAVDFETGLLYVADSGNNRIDIFKNGGKELSTPPSISVPGPAWLAVDNNATSAGHHDIYVTTTGAFTVKRFEPDGTLADEFGEQGDGTPEGCQLERANDPIAVGPNGDVYLADSYQTGASNNFANRIVKFDNAGNCIGVVSLFEGSNQTITDFAVDSEGVIYVRAEGADGGVRKYSPTGTLEAELSKGLETGPLAIDAADHLFAVQRGEDVFHTRLIRFFTEYSTSGEIVRRWGYAQGALSTSGLAALHTADGDLFASEASGVRYFKAPPPGPVVYPEACKVKNNAPGSVRATLQAEVNPEGKATSFKFEYLTQAQYEAQGNKFENAESSLTEEALGGPADFELHEAAQTVEPLQDETEYRCRIVAKNADGETVGQEGIFETGPPFEFGPAWTSEVGQTTAVVNAEGNPKGAPATGQIEYLTEAQYQANGQTFAGALSAPTPPLDYGNSETMVLKSAQLTSLLPGTLYRYRLRARDEVCPGGATSCPNLEHTFRTYLSEPPEVDGRRYELVSPGQKNSAEVLGDNNGKGVIEPNSVLIQAGAASGEAVTYTSWTSFGNAAAAPATSQYLSKRSAGGWGTENISPFGFQSNLFVPPYLGFNPDLGFGAVKAGEVPLVPGCPAAFENFYLYEAASGGFRCLTPEAPQSPSSKFGYSFTYGGASEDGSRVFFRTRVRYANAPAGDGNYLYEWHDGKLSLVSVLPGQSEPAAPTPKSSFGMRSEELTQTGQTRLRNAISADGTRVIWTYVPDNWPVEPSQLLMRINGAETIQLDKVQSGGPPGQKPGEGVFWAGSKDASIVYFTSQNRLTTGLATAPGEPDLYRYELNKPIGSRLTDLTKGPVPGNVKGVIGASDDGSVVYFVAGAALTPEAETNQGDQHSEAGKNNLYVYDGAESKTRFIATLSNEDALSWEQQPKALSARVTPDGQHLAFLSVESKALANGFDNTLAAKSGRFAAGDECQISEAGTLTGSELCPQAFLYDKQTKSLACASCNPAGSRPLGPAMLPFWSSMSEGPRYLSDDGSRFFFESFDRLLSADENNLRDVYEFELPGTGSCSSASPNFDSTRGGCHFLVSTGRSSDESRLLDASTTGRDVFFSTRQVLVGWDVNDNLDIYDYREGGGFPEPVTPVPPCAGEASCSPPSPAAPSPPNPATPSFNGPGNPKQKKAKKHKKKQGKGKKKSKGKKQNKKKGKGEKGRTGR